MTESIIVALITGAVTSLATLLGFISSEKNRKSKIAEEHLKEFNEVKDKLDEHRSEYLSKIQNVEASILEMQNAYRSTVAIVELKIDALEKKQDVHNNLISRMYECEKKIEVQDEMIKVANHRIEDLEKSNG